MAGLAAQRAEPVSDCNIQSSTSPEIHPKARAAGVRGAIVVPMVHGTEVVGTIGIGCSSERTFSAKETRWLLDFGRKLASHAPITSPRG
jgi:putative methionine-R-sulfoxide reductase with GAF domain